jgi:heterodisulfide reductase subunit B
MRYLYYPGCSLEGSAREYDRSTRAFMTAMGVELVEIEDWSCCGASAAEAASRYLSLALPARNLALAEKIADIDDILVPCSACYLNLKKVEEKIKKEPAVRQAVNTILAEEQLQLRGGKRTRHLLDVMVRDLGAEAIARRVTHPLGGLRIAPYYGCQCLRPYPVFDDPEAPRSMEPLLAAAGAAIHHWDMGGKCCGASHMNTKMEVGLELVAAILRRANGADAVVTVCPMCQMNLEGYQGKVSRLAGEDLSISVLYLPQLLGLALGLTAEEVGLDLNLSVYRNFREKLQRQAAVAA